MVREVARRLASTGVRLLDIEILRLEPETDVARYRAVLETGARLGARYALVAGNDGDESRLVERFAALAALAAPLGLSLALEPMPFSDVRDARAAWRIVERPAAANAGVLIDALHFDRAGSEPSDVAAIPGSRLPYVQLCDAPAQRPADTPTLLH